MECIVIHTLWEMIKMAIIKQKKTGEKSAIPLDQVTDFFNQTNENGDLIFTKTDYDVILSADENRTVIRATIEEKVADDKSLLGTTADAASYALDDTAMDILAIEASADNSYKAARISLFQELHGTDSWKKAVTNAQKWFDLRKAGDIKLPSDVKGIQSVFTDVATRSTGVANILERAMI